MPQFTQAHINARLKYHTQEQADYWLTHLNTTQLTQQMTDLIENIPYFFLATASTSGYPNVNFKGTKNNTLIKVLNPTTLIFYDYAGNGILHSIGDILSNPKIGMLIIDFKHDIRIKINGSATIIDEGSSFKHYSKVFNDENIIRIIKVNIEYVIQNCSKHLHIVRKTLINRSTK